MYVIHTYIHIGDQTVGRGACALAPKAGRKSRGGRGRGAAGACTRGAPPPGISESAGLFSMSVGLFSVSMELFSVSVSLFSVSVGLYSKP
jgi:hypothetical protein